MHATFTERRFPGNYLLEYGSHAEPMPEERFGAYRVWKGDIRIAGATLNTPCGPGMAQAMAHNAALGMMKTDKRD